MNTDSIRATLETYNKEELITLLLENGIDRAFGVITRNMAQTFYENIESGKTLIMLDIANMHAMNHLYGMAAVDQRIKTVTDFIRHSDMVIRWGSDEIVIMLNSGDTEQYIDRLDRLMADNELYGVYGIVTTSDSLAESVERADRIVMTVKLMLEETGQKPDRNETYRVLPSWVAKAA